MKKLLILNVLLLATVHLSAASQQFSRQEIKERAMRQLKELQRIENAVLSGKKVTDLEKSYFMFGKKIEEQAMRDLKAAAVMRKEDLAPIKKSVHFGPHVNTHHRHYNKNELPQTHFDPSKQSKSILKKR